jgi:ABC-type antimicrobial peptide transport system permease subunit
MALPLSYALRNLTHRRGRTAITVGVVALVVIATTLLLGLVSSLRRTLVATGDARNLIVLRKGSNNDGSSQLPLEAYQTLRFFDGIAKNAQGQPLVSPELVVQPFFHREGGGRENVLVRGVEPVALAVHGEVRMAEGRMLAPSSTEAVVGRGIAARYPEIAIGKDLRFGRGSWRVVGILDAGGSSFESEVWVDARQLAADAKRTLPYSGMRIRAADGADRDALARRIEDDPRWALEAKPETDYYAEQAESSRTLFAIVVLVAIMAGIGAGFGAANTMYAAVQARTAEIGTLRALGFSRADVLVSFLTESVAIALLGFVVGGAVAVVAGALLSQALGGIGFAAVTFTTNVVALRVAPGDLATSALIALAIGVVGGLAPAWRAAHLRPVDALRRA